MQGLLSSARTEFVSLGAVVFFFEVIEQTYIINVCLLILQAPSLINDEPSALGSE